MLTHARSAVTISSMMCPAHMATRRVEIGSPPTSCAAWARNRLRTAAQRLAQIRPVAMGSLAVSNLCRFAYDFHSLKISSICQRNRRVARRGRARTAYAASWCTDESSTIRCQAARWRRTSTISVLPRLYSTSRSILRPACCATKRQPDRRGQRQPLAVNPCSSHPRIVALGEPHDEAAAVFANGVEVRGAWISAVREQQPIFQRRWVREKVAFLFAVRCDLDRAHLVGEAAIGGVNFFERERRFAHVRGRRCGAAQRRALPADQRFVEGTSRAEIAAPPFLQPSRRSHVRGWYTTSGS